VDANSIPNISLDLAMPLGALCHIPDTGLAIRDIARKIKGGEIFLCNLLEKGKERFEFSNTPLRERALYNTGE